MKCRSDPHVVDNVTWTITSLGLSIAGSSTVSTDRSLTPFHTSALMSLLPFSAIRVASAGVVLDGRHLTGHEQCAGTVERLEDEPPGQCSGCRAADAGDHLGAPLLRRIAEVEDDPGVTVGVHVDVAHTGFVVGGDDAFPLRGVCVVQGELPTQPGRPGTGDYSHVAEHLREAVRILKQAPHVSARSWYGDRLKWRGVARGVDYLLGDLVNELLDVSLCVVYDAHSLPPLDDRWSMVWSYPGQNERNVRAAAARRTKPEAGRRNWRGGDPFPP